MFSCRRKLLRKFNLARLRLAQKAMYDPCSQPIELGRLLVFDVGEHFLVVCNRNGPNPFTDSHGFRALRRIHLHLLCSRFQV